MKIKRILVFLVVTLLVLSSVYLPSAALVLETELPCTFDTANAVEKNIEGSGYNSGYSLNIYPYGEDNQVLYCTPTVDSVLELSASGDDFYGYNVFYKIFLADGTEVESIRYSNRYTQFKAKADTDYFFIPYLDDKEGLTEVTASLHLKVYTQEYSDFNISSRGVKGYANTAVNVEVNFTSLGFAIKVPLEYTSSDENVVVPTEGIFYLKNPGEATVTATDPVRNRITRCTVTVLAPDELELNKEIEREVDTDILYIRQKFVPNEDGIYFFDFKSSNSNAVKHTKLYDENGNFLKKTDGSGIYRVSAELKANKAYYVQTHIKNTKVILNTLVTKATETENIKICVGEKRNSYVGDTFKLCYSLSSDVSGVASVNWQSDNTDVATVDAEGNVSVLAVGKATITVTTDNGCSDSYNVVAVEPDVMALDIAATYEFSDTNEKYIASFSPLESGWYYVTLSGEQGKLTGEILSVTGSAYGTFSTEHGTARYLSTGRTYNFILNNGQLLGNISLTITKHSAIKSISVVNKPYRSTLYETDSVVFDGLKLKLTLEDGTYDFYEYGQSSSYCLGYEVKLIDQSGDSGIPYSTTRIEADASSTVLEFPIIETDVERIDLLSGPTRDYVWGDVLFGAMDGSETYMFYPVDYTGLSFNVIYKNGTSKVYSYSDFDMLNGTIDGYDFFTALNGWYAENEVLVYFFYRGAAFYYTVTVTDAPYSNLSITKNPDNEIVVSGLFKRDLFGMEITVQNGNEGNKSVVLSKDNTVYTTTQGITVIMSVLDDNLLRIIYDSSAGGYVVEYMGMQCIYKGKTEPTKTIECIDFYNITAASGDGAKLRINYKYGFSDTVTLNVFSKTLANVLADGTEVYDIYATTDLGILYYTLEYKVGSKMINYNIGDYTFINALPDYDVDVNGDGREDTIDLSDLKLSLANMENEVVNGDINGDNVVDTTDLAMLKIELAGIVTI